jgi:hypothetical protein
MAMMGFSNYWGACKTCTIQCGAIKFYFMERTHEPLHLDRLSSVHWKIMDITTSFIWIIIFFNRVFNNLKLWGYVGTNTGLLYVEFCNFVQCHIFVSSLSCCFMKGVLNIRGTNMVADKYQKLYRPINLCLEFIPCTEESRLWVQSLNATSLFLWWGLVRLVTGTSVSVWLIGKYLAVINKSTTHHPLEKCPSV